MTERSTSGAYPAWLLPLAWVLLALAVTGGLWSRFVGLGVWNLSLDEYYFMSSVQFILDKGIPEFPCGGYYVRGLLQQYLTVPLLALTDDPELAGRIPPVIANLLTAPVLYAVARHVVAKPVALIAAALFLLSLWEIEFARFARMYAFFQLTFLLQVLWLLRWRAGHQASIWLLPLTAFVAIFVHEGAVFVLALCFIPLVVHPAVPGMPKPSSISFWYWPRTIFVAICTVAFTVIDLRSMGAPKRTPDDFKRPSSEGRLDLPDLQFERITDHLGSPLTWLAVAMIIAALLFVCWRLRADYRAGRLDWRGASVVAAVAALCLLHLFMLAIVVTFLFLLLGYFRNLRLGSALWYGICAGIMGLGWLVLLQSPVPLGNYPSFYWGFVSTYLTAVPLETVWIVVGIGLTALVTLATAIALGGSHTEISTLPSATGGSIGTPSSIGRSGDHSGADSGDQALQLMMLVFLGCLTIFCLLNTRFTFTRYSFFLYPLMLIFIVFTLDWIARKATCKLAGPAKAQLLAAIVLLGGTGAYAATSEHYGWKHLIHVDDAAYSLRSAYPLFREFHYYQRDDFESAGNKVAELASPNDVVISSSPGADFYIPNISYIFHTQDDVRYRETISCRGTSQLWTGIPMLSDYKEVRELVEAGTIVWFITGENSNGRKDLVDGVVSQWPEATLMLESLDGSDRLYRISRD